MAALERAKTLNTEVVLGALLKGQITKGDLYWERIQKCSKTIAGMPVRAATDST